MKNTTGVYISRLDHLRFLAAFMVFHWHFAVVNHLSHADVPVFWPLSLLREGHTGVAFFMTISGYIFSRLSIGCSIDYRVFLRNRLYRVAPLFIVWVILYLHLWKIDATRLLLTMMIDPSAVVPDNGWSVVVEFQCYLILPFLVLICNRYGVRFLAALLALSILLKAGYWAQSGSVEYLSYSTIFGRIDQFLCGMIAARVLGNLRGAPAWVSAGASVVLLSYAYHRFHALGGYFGESSDGHSKRLLWAVWPAIEGALYAALIASYIALPLKVPKWLDKTLSKLGEVSYSLYLGQAFVLTATIPVVERWLGWSVTNFTQELIVGTLVFLPICVAAACLTYYLIEKPFIDGFRRPYLIRLDGSTTSSANSRKREKIT